VVAFSKNIRGDDDTEERRRAEQVFVKDTNGSPAWSKDLQSS